MLKRHLLGAALMLLATAANAAGPIVVHRDPGCGCCEQWAAQVRAQFGRRITMVDDQSRATFQRARGVPAALASCHTAVIDGLVFEGHVPIADIKRVLAQRPKGITGLAVAGMPVGSPGMEVPGRRGDPYVVVAFGPSGTRIFARHQG
ncbi:DUF411 domain-containing protein [Novosphingobium aquimarinum]|uniref:DUF411 domain-containing protein n=1 Tax=Novosphingobium aquimarinum TaxID=2682494 RepID=UPI0012EB49E4|nr:DUF411 domain-containing protein [Novosphingobium aquimarinum]